MRNVLSRRERLVLVSVARGEDRVKALEREMAIINQRVRRINHLEAYLKTEEFEEEIQRKLSLPISELRLSKRVNDALRAFAWGYQTLGDICEINSESLMADCGLDEKMISALKKALGKKGLFMDDE